MLASLHPSRFGKRWTADGGRPQGHRLHREAHSLGPGLSILSRGPKWFWKGAVATQANVPFSDNGPTIETLQLGSVRAQRWLLPASAVQAAIARPGGSAMHRIVILFAGLLVTMAGMVYIQGADRRNPPDLIALFGSVSFDLDEISSPE